MNPPCSSVLLLYTRFTNELPPEQWNKYLRLVPTWMQDRIQRYRRWQDRHASLLGKLLLCQGFQRCLHIPAQSLSNLLHEMQFTEYGRPYIESEFDFSLSHSGEMVVCAIAKGIRVGIDVELVRPIDFQAFIHVMHPREWHEIVTSEQPEPTFFRFWVRKESLIKADGSGLTDSLDKLCVIENRVLYRNTHWFLQDIHIDPSHFICLTANCARFELIPIFQSLFDLS